MREKMRNNPNLDNVNINANTQFSKILSICSHDNGLNETLICKRMTGYNQHLNIVLIFFHILVIKEYWALMESRILLKLVLGDVRIVELSVSSHE